jgi:hypothetical protein
MPKPKQQEIETLRRLLSDLKLSVIDRSDMRLAA